MFFHCVTSINRLHEKCLRIMKIWYGEDLLDQYEHNNDGTSCVDVYGRIDN